MNYRDCIAPFAALLLLGCHLKADEVPAFPTTGGAVSDQGPELAEQMAAGHEMFGGGSTSGGVPMISNDVAGRDDELGVQPRTAGTSIASAVGGMFIPDDDPEQTHVVGGHSNAGGSAQPSITPIAGDQLVFEQSENVLTQLEMNGSLDDASGQNRPGHLVGRPTMRFVDSDFGQALLVEGGNDAFDWTYNHASGLRAPWTVELVFTITRFPGNWCKILGHDPDSEQGIWLKGTEPKNVSVWPDGNRSEFVWRFDEHEWLDQVTYLAFASPMPDQLIVYLNGRRLDRASPSSDGLDMPNQVFSFFQRTRSPENNNVTALIDAVRISSVARTDEEIQRVWQRIDIVSTSSSSGQ